MAKRLVATIALPTMVKSSAQIHLRAPAKLTMDKYFAHILMQGEHGIGQEQAVSLITAQATVATIAKPIMARSSVQKRQMAFALLITEKLNAMTR